VNFSRAPNPSHVGSLAIGIVSVSLGLLVRPKPGIAAEPAEAAPAPSRAFPLLFVLGVAVAAAIVAAAFRAFRPDMPQFVKLLAVAGLTLLLPLGFLAMRGWIRRASAQDREQLPWLARRVVRLSPLLAIVPWLAMLAGSLVESAFLERGTMLYVPFLLLVAATGLTPPGRVRWFLLPLLVLVLFLHSWSVSYARHNDHTLRDYRGLGAELNRRLGKDDLILITNEYSDPPLLYYMRDRYAQFVPSDWKAAVAAKGAGNVWIVRYEDQEVTFELEDAVEGLEPREGISVRGARALQFVR
jgi:hypothetical protein